jgi:hypothetical protein
VEAVWHGRSMPGNGFARIKAIVRLTCDRSTKLQSFG